MSNKTDSIVSDQQRQDIQHLTFEERVQYGAENAVRCMGVTSRDRVFIIADYQRESIAHRVAVAALTQHADVTVRFLEHYGVRPLTVFSDNLRNDSHSSSTDCHILYRNSSTRRNSLSYPIAALSGPRIKSPPWPYDRHR